MSGFEPKLQGHEACDLTVSLHRVLRQNRELNSVLQSMNLVLYHLSYFVFFVAATSRLIVVLKIYIKLIE